MISKVKDVWKKIVQEFPEYKVTITPSEEEKNLEFQSVVKNLKLGKRIADNLKEELVKKEREGIETTLWDVFLSALNEVNRKNYKSAVHKERKIDSISQAVIEYSLLLSI